MPAAAKHWVQQAGNAEDEGIAGADDDEIGATQELLEADGIAGTELQEDEAETGPTGTLLEAGWYGAELQDEEEAGIQEEEEIGPTGALLEAGGYGAELQLLLDAPQ